MVTSASKHSDAGFDVSSSSFIVGSPSAPTGERPASGGVSWGSLVIRAPVAGTVVGLRFKTLGGVIPPREPIVDIVPYADELIIEARVPPADIDDVSTEDPVYITFPSLPQRGLLRTEGKILSVSADTLTDPRTQAPYYLARVEVDRSSLVLDDKPISLTAGMPAEVYIETQPRTVLVYLMQPFLRSLERSFREN